MKEILEKIHNILERIFIHFAPYPWDNRALDIEELKKLIDELPDEDKP